MTIPITPGTGDSGDDDDDPNQGGGGQDPDPEPSKAITISDNDTGYLTKGVTVVGDDYPTDVVVKVSASNKIQNVYVKVDTNDDFFRSLLLDYNLVSEDPNEQGFMGVDLTSDEAVKMGLNNLFTLPESNADSYNCFSRPARTD